MPENKIANQEAIEAYGFLKKIPVNMRVENDGAKGVCITASQVLPSGSTWTNGLHASGVYLDFDTGVIDIANKMRGLIQQVVPVAAPNGHAEDDSAGWQRLADLVRRGVVPLNEVRRSPLPEWSGALEGFSTTEDLRKALDSIEARATEILSSLGTIVVLTELASKKLGEFPKV